MILIMTGIIVIIIIIITVVIDDNDGYRDKITMMVLIKI